MSDTPNIPTPQAEIDFIKLRKEAEEMVNRSPLYRKFIDGTPLENDIATWMVLFARDAILDHVSTLQAEVERLRKDNEKLELWLAEELGIEKSEPNAGDDPTKQFWIGLDQQCYESMRQAINAVKNKRP